MIAAVHSQTTQNKYRNGIGHIPRDVGRRAVALYRSSRERVISHNRSACAHDKGARALALILLGLVSQPIRERRLAAIEFRYVVRLLKRSRRRDLLLRLLPM